MKTKAPKPAYQIAELLPMALRRKMVKPAYDEVDGSVMVCATGRCPMGWLFADPARGNRLEEARRLPSGWTIARRIKRLFPARAKDYTVSEIFDLAVEFTAAWDGGRISDLRKALGVPK